MLTVEHTNQFKKDLKKAKKRGKDLSLIKKIMKLIEQEKTLSQKYKNHALSGNWNHHLELHLGPDWLLIYKLLVNIKTVIFVRTGSHSDLFN